MDTAIRSEHRGLDRAPAQSRPHASLEHHIPATEWLWLTVAVLLGLAIRIPFFRIPMVADEGGYAYATRGWLEGTGTLYDDLWISRPQGIFFVYAGIFDLLGSGTIALRFAAWIATALTTAAIWALARLLINPRSGVVAAFVFVILSASPALEGYTANAEIFMGAPAALVALWLYRLARTGWHGGQLVAIGVLIGITSSLKPSGAVMFPVAIAYIWMLGIRMPGAGCDKRVLIRRMLQVAGGVAIVGMLSLLHGWYLGWSNFIYATVTYRLTAQSAATVGFEHHIAAIGRLIGRSWNVISLVLVVLALLHRDRLRGALDKGSARSRSQRRLTRDRFATLSLTPARMSAQSRPDDDHSLLLRLWLAGSVLGISIGGDWWSHYLIQLTAPLAIWLAAAIARLWLTLSTAGRRRVAPLLIGLLIGPYWVLVLGTPEDMAQNLFDHPGIPAQEAVAAHLQESSEPDATIYVAFDQASIYYIADRLPAYRHLYDQELRGIPSSYSDLIMIIQSPDRPEFIVGTRQPGPFADNSRAFWDEVGKYYKLDVTIEGVPIYRDKSLRPP